jgi:pyridoxine/pyridoxamine 5'-phosphate oxidase
MARGRAGVPHPRSPARPDDPIERFRGWLAAATRARSPLAEAVVLATADRQGRPSARYVLLRAVDERGFVFSTDARSRKAKDLRTNRHAALTWYWPRSARQARIEGRVEEITAAESDAHWQAEPRANQLLVSVCRQSAPPNHLPADRARLATWTAAALRGRRAQIGVASRLKIAAVSMTTTRSRNRAISPSKTTRSRYFPQLKTRDSPAGVVCSTR